MIGWASGSSTATTTTPTPGKSNATGSKSLMERDPRGWNVSPSPDGRGKPEQPKQPPVRPPRMRVAWRWVLFVLVLLTINYMVAGLVAPEKNKQVTVPYSPYFLDQVRHGNVKEISSQGEKVDGRFRKQVKFDDTTTNRFKTQVPTFADTDQLSQLLLEKKVTIKA